MLYLFAYILCVFLFRQKKESYWFVCSQCVQVSFFWKEVCVPHNNRIIAEKEWNIHSKALRRNICLRFISLYAYIRSTYTNTNDSSHRMPWLLSAHKHMRTWSNATFNMMACGRVFVLNFLCPLHQLISISSHRTPAFNQRLTNDCEKSIILNWNDFHEMIWMPYDLIMCVCVPFSLTHQRRGGNFFFQWMAKFSE